MLDLNYVTENLEYVAKKLRDRGTDVDLETLSRLNNERKSLQTEISTLRHEHGTESKKIGALFKEGKKEEADWWGARTLKVRFKARAGTRTIAVSFLKRTLAYEGVRSARPRIA